MLTGKMDLETSPYMVAQGDYTYAKNISSTVTDGTIKPVQGNRIVNYVLPSGTNKVIGFKEDVTRERAFYFVHNSTGKHSILIFNKVSRSVQKLIENLTDSGGVDILKFSSDKKILHADILYRETAEGDILSWTCNNASPREVIINKLLNNEYGVVLEEYLEAAKRPPLGCPSCTYINDPLRTVNSLRKKLFQFKYRWVYDDFSKSTWGPISKIPMPTGLFTSADLDNDPTKNNAIDITLSTGNKKVKRIEVAARISLGSSWSDFFLIDSIEKAAIALGDNLEYVYRFYNDAVYPYADVTESNLLHDWVPRYAQAQCLANGNVKVYGNITEGYDRVAGLNISVTSSTVTNSSSSAEPPSARWVGSNFTTGYVEILGTPIPGTRYQVLWRASNLVGPTTFMDYRAVAGDTNNSVATALAASAIVAMRATASANRVNLSFINQEVFFQVYVYPGTIASSYSYESTWNWWSRYLIGVVYFDEQGRTNGAHIDRTSTRTNSDVITSGYAISSNVGLTPILNVSINHAAPSWARKYQLVRSRNMAIGDFLFWRSNLVITDSQYYYFSVQTLYDKRDAQSSYVPNWDFAEGDRVRIAIANVGGTQTYPGTDYLVVGVEELDLAANPGKKKYVKVKKPSTSAPTYTGDTLLQLWRPAVTGGQVENEVFYEFGEVYDLYESGGVRYHKGTSQDQTAAQPANITLYNGDVYYRSRTFSSNDALWVMDNHYSDDFTSRVNANGRGQAIDFNARETVYQTLVRFGGTYQSGTSINDINRFYFDDLDEYDRQFGSIQRLRINDRYMRVFQELKCGRVPVYQQVIKDSVGGDVMAQSNKLLNNIQYYAGEFGIGKHPESLASNNFADYFVDTNRGAVVRLSLDGLSPISVLHSANNYFVTELSARRETNFIYGVFDAAENRYILSMEAVGDRRAVTIAFNEQNKGFESFYDYLPEFMGNLGTLMLTFKLGALWTHDSPTYCNFFGVQYKPLVRVAFNDAPMVKKTFQAVSLISGAKWYIPAITTSIGKASRVPASYFIKREDGYHAPLLRDQGSNGGLLSGSTLKGNYILVDFEKENGSTGEELQYVEIKYSVSNLNAR
jgi:hypothetical protein